MSNCPVRLLAVGRSAGVRPTLTAEGRGRALEIEPGTSDVDDYVDLIAERAVQLGGTAEGTARQVAEKSALDEYSAGGSGEQHVEAVADALADFGRSARQAIHLSAEANDQDTSDIFTEVSRGVDKWLWFVEAHLQAGHRSAATTRRDQDQAAQHPGH